MSKYDINNGKNSMTEQQIINYDIENIKKSFQSTIELKMLT